MIAGVPALDYDLNNDHLIFVLNLARLRKQIQVDIQLTLLQENENA